MVSIGQHSLVRVAESARDKALKTLGEAQKELRKWQADLELAMTREFDFVNAGLNSKKDRKTLNLGTIQNHIETAKVRVNLAEENAKLAQNKIHEANQKARLELIKEQEVLYKQDVELLRDSLNRASKHNANVAKRYAALNALGAPVENYAWRELNEETPTAETKFAHWTRCVNTYLES